MSRPSAKLTVALACLLSPCWPGLSLAVTTTRQGGPACPACSAARSITPPVSASTVKNWRAAGAVSGERE